MQLSLIAALDRNFAIGKDNALPWQLPDDLRRFKALTLGKPLLMGRKTAESLGRALPGRRNIVLTHSATAPFAGMDAVASLQDALNMVADADELCVIGGGEIFRITLPIATEMSLTWVDSAVEQADAFFPEFDARHWQVIFRQSHAADARHACAFEFVDYRRQASAPLSAP